jgi:hypothetical protein
MEAMLEKVPTTGTETEYECPKCGCEWLNTEYQNCPSCPTGTMSILGKEGDIKIAWNKNNADEVSAACATYDSFKAKGYLAFKVTAGGKQGEQIRAFTAEAEQILLVPPMVGG